MHSGTDDKQVSEPPLVEERPTQRGKFEHLSYLAS